MLLFVVRHSLAQTSPLIGSTYDPPLSNLGRQQACALGERLAGEPLEACYVSPLSRARETAVEITAALSVPLPVTVTPWLAEYHRGDLEFHRDETDPLFAAAWQEGSWQQWPNGDSRRAFRSRIASGLAAIVEAGHHQVLLVTHGGVINELFCLFVGISGRKMFEPLLGSLSLAELENGRCRFLCFNDVWHLEDPLPVLRAHGAPALAQPCT